MKSVIHELARIVQTVAIADQPVCEAVWDLYRSAVEHLGAVSTMIERDDNMPEFEDLLTELARVRAIAEPVLANRVA